MKIGYKNLIFIGIFIAIICSISLISAFITDITLISPANNAWINNVAPEFTFNAQSSILAPFSCSLYINSTNMATNNSVINGMNTILIPPIPLVQGPHNWYITCIDSDLIPRSSDIWTINIDFEDPIITLVEPIDGYETNSREIDFVFNVTDNLDSVLACTLYIDGNIEEDGNVNNGEEVEWRVDNLDREDHNWYVKCEDNAGNEGTSDNWDFEVLEVEYCKYGQQGNDLEINLEEPEDGDDFYVGENIKVEIDIESDEDFDLVVEAELYDLDDEDTVVDEEHEFEIDEDEDETVNIYLRVPNNIDEDHEFVVNVKVYEDGQEDEQCQEESIDVDIKRRKHSVVIESLMLSPETISCGSSFNLNLEIENVGKEDEDVKIHIYNTLLNIDYERKISLDDGDDYTINEVFFIPKDLNEATYDIEVSVFFNYDNTYRDSVKDAIPLIVQGNCLPPAEPVSSDVSISLLQTGDAFAGRDFTAKVVITNTGNFETTYSLGVSGYEGWANLVKVEPESITLSEGSIGYVYITLRSLESAAGVNSFKVTVNFDGKSEEQSMNVEIKRESEVASSWDQFWFEVKRNWGWALLNLVLIVAVIVLIVFVARAGKHGRRQEATEIRLRPLNSEYRPRTRRKRR